MAVITWKYVKPLSEANAIEDFEKKNNLSLPSDLKECIKANNGGRPSLNVFDTDDSKERVFKTLLSFNESDVENIYKYFPIINSQSNNLIPFASDPSGNYLCLQNNKIVLFLHDNLPETERLEYVSDTFSSLLGKLHE
jgi:cell wall assembly regulator SMI1